MDGFEVAFANTETFHLRNESRTFVVIVELIILVIPGFTVRTSRQPEWLQWTFTLRDMCVVVGMVEMFVPLTSGPTPPFLPRKRPTNPMNSMLFTAVTKNEYVFSMKTFSAPGARKIDVRAEVFIATLTRTATTLTSRPSVAAVRCPIMFDLPRRPFKKSTFSSGTVLGMINAASRKLTTGKRTPLAEEMVCGGCTPTRCLCDEASRCTMGGRTIGMRVTHEQV